MTFYEDAGNVSFVHIFTSLVKGTTSQMIKHRYDTSYHKSEDANANLNIPLWQVTVTPTTTPPPLVFYVCDQSLV